MANGIAVDRSRTEALGWWIMVGLGALLTLNGVALYLFVEGTSQGQTVGLLHAAFGALALALALGGARRGGSGDTRWVWNAGWVVAASLAVIGLHILSEGGTGIAGWYFGLTAVAVLGQTLSRPR